MSQELSLIGKSVIRTDARDKVTGAAKYARDVVLPGMLHGKLLISPYAHAKIIAIDASRAEKLPGVKVVLTGKDVPPKGRGRFVSDRNILARGRVRFIGEPVAAVAASTIEAAEEALELIKVKYEELPAIFDVEEAMKPDCPVVLHPDLASYERPSYAYLGRDLPGPNVHSHNKVRKGNVDEGFQKADLIVENRFTTVRLSHCQLEPYSSVATVETDGTLTVWAMVHKMFSDPQYELSKAFDLPRSKVRIIEYYVGGNFGAERSAEWFSALLAVKTGKPVKVVFSREECFTTAYNRIPMVVYIKDGVKSDGTLIASEMKVICNSGAYVEQTLQIMRVSSFAIVMYRVPNFKWDAYGVYTNEPPSNAFRGFGNSQVVWAREQQMDIIAEKLGIDPVELRKKNIVNEGEENLRGEITHSIGAKECLDRVAEWIEWGKPSRAPVGNLRIGKGLALSNKTTKPDSVSAAVVKIEKDGTIEFRHGSEEVGQGVNTVLSQIVAEEFNVPMEKVKVIWGDTARVPYDSGAISSQTTFYAGNALRLACQDAKRQLFELAAPKLGAAPQDLETRDGKVYLRQSPEKEITITELFMPVSGSRGDQIDATCLAEGAELVGKATFFLKGLTGEDPETGQGKRLQASYCYIAQAVEVAVDVETGVVKVLRFCAACDWGRPINPKLCEGQMEGGAGMGIGSTLFEEMVLDHGKVLNPNFTDYRVPTMMEIPSGNNMKSILVSAPHREGPFGAKGGGEAAMTPSAPAIANAIYNATGVRIMDLPITPERILKVLKSKGKLSNQSSPGRKIKSRGSKTAK